MLGWLLDKDGQGRNLSAVFTPRQGKYSFCFRLMLHHGNWNGETVGFGRIIYQRGHESGGVSEGRVGEGFLGYYGFQIWIMNYKGQQNPYFPGNVGTVCYAILRKRMP